MENLDLDAKGTDEGIRSRLPNFCENEPVDFSKMNTNNISNPLIQSNQDLYCFDTQKMPFVDLQRTCTPNQDFNVYPVADYFTHPPAWSTSTSLTQSSVNSSSFQTEWSTKFFTASANVMMRGGPSDENLSNGKIFFPTINCTN